jgi:hypothetical protein
VDLPLAVAGSVVVMFAGAWIGLLVPRVMRRHHENMAEAAGFGPEDADPQSRPSSS